MGTFVKKRSLVTQSPPLLLFISASIPPNHSLPPCILSLHRKAALIASLNGQAILSCIQLLRDRDSLHQPYSLIRSPGPASPSAIHSSLCAAEDLNTPALAQPHLNRPPSPSQNFRKKARLSCASIRVATQSDARSAEYKDSRARHAGRHIPICSRQVQ